MWLNMYLKIYGETSAAKEVMLELRCLHNHPSFVITVKRRRQIITHGQLSMLELIQVAGETRNVIRPDFVLYKPFHADSSKIFRFIFHYRPWHRSLNKMLEILWPMKILRAWLQTCPKWSSKTCLEGTGHYIGSARLPILCAVGAIERRNPNLWLSVLISGTIFTAMAVMVRWFRKHSRVSNLQELLREDLTDYRITRGKSLCRLWLWRQYMHAFPYTRSMYLVDGPEAGLCQSRRSWSRFCG